MNKNPFFISKPAFNELCKYICCQLQPSGSEQIDRETLNFAIYWQICFILGQEVELLSGLKPKTAIYQRLMQTTIDSQSSESFDVSEIVDQNISELFQKEYPKADNFNVQPQESSGIWFEKLTLA